MPMDTGTSSMFPTGRKKEASFLVNPTQCRVWVIQDQYSPAEMHLPGADQSQTCLNIGVQPDWPHSTLELRGRELLLSGKRLDAPGGSFCSWPSASAWAQTYDEITSASPLNILYKIHHTQRTWKHQRREPYSFHITASSSSWPAWSPGNAECMSHCLSSGRHL